jgi:hypothetical protein
VDSDIDPILLVRMKMRKTKMMKMMKKMRKMMKAKKVNQKTGKLKRKILETWKGQYKISRM